MMKLTTIIIGILILVGCTGIGLQTFSSRSSPNEVTSGKAKEQQTTVIEPVGSGAVPKPLPTPTMTTPTIRESTPTKQQTIKKIDDVQTNLFNASLAFALRDKANISEDIKAQLLIDPTTGIEQLEKELTVRGQTVSKKVQVSKIVTAKITAPDFDVTLITPEEQVLSFSKPTEWLWTLSPKSSGKFEVNLSVNAVINISGRETSHHLKTFEKTIVVEITTQQIVKNWIAKNWQWVISTLIIPLLLFFFKDKVLKLLKRKNKS